MTLRSILVPVRGDGKGEGVLDHALSLAKRHNAHLDVLHCRPRPGDMIPTGILVPDSVRDAIRTSAKTIGDEEEAEMRKLFDDYCAKRGVVMADKLPWPADGVSASWREVTGKQARVVGVRGRLADLIAVAKPDRDLNLGLNTLQAALMESGKMVLMCPPRPVESVGARVAIAWNGSGEAARAMTAALPILCAADAVTILATTDRELPVSAEEANLYLQSHGVSSSVHGFKRGSESVPRLLLDTARKAGADCLLMGAYGHSREFEMIMGGVTQHVVDHADLPILFMH
jgi:nucleotide-binding universal stress UspA family protein